MKQKVNYGDTHIMLQFAIRADVQDTLREWLKERGWGPLYDSPLSDTLTEIYDEMLNAVMEERDILEKWSSQAKRWSDNEMYDLDGEKIELDDIGQKEALEDYEKIQRHIDQLDDLILLF